MVGLWKRSVLMLALFTLVTLLAALLTGCSSDSGKDEVDESAPPTSEAQAARPTDNPVSVLIVHSYHADLTWEKELEDGILRGLGEGGYSETQGNLVLDRFWLDTARNTSLAYQSAVGDEAAAFIAEKQPDVVIATDDEAIRLVVRPSDSEGIPFVFTGLNSDPDNFLLAGKRNVTGVLERPHVAETLEWVKRVQPDAQSVTYLFDSSPTTFMSWPHIMLSLRGSDIAARYLHVAYSYEEWQERVLEASERGGVLIVGRYNTLKDHSGNLIAPEEVMRWTVENSAVPVVALWSHTVEEGALGGAVITGEMQGYEAGALAVRVLQGEAPLEIGFVTPRRAQLVLNSTAAEHWNVSFPLDLLEVSTVYGSQNQAG